MLRITKLTDYGVALLAYFAAEREGEPHNARDVAAAMGLPLPTVSKILKTLSRGGLLVSLRGAKGGYGLSRSPEEISVAEVIGALEGPIGITECTASAPGTCAQEPLCGVRANWQIINEAVHGALEKITLAEMLRPAPDFGKWLEEAGAALSGPAGPRADTVFPIRE
jgi:FeS assembly SUF system regulator